MLACAIAVAGFAAAATTAFTAQRAAASGSTSVLALEEQSLPPEDLASPAASPAALPAPSPAAAGAKSA
ncbi:MAG TPA: hypothetical protein VMI09_04240, partial [Candidatus Binataceae bacterium]|nr:hypothetical protein [Candidatus Binataceae bacterium]